MSRKSRRSAGADDGLASFFHVAPPSSVRRMVFPAPLAHATRSETALTPRSRTVTADGCSVQDGATRTAARPATRTQLAPDNRASLHDERHLARGAHITRRIS